MGFHGSGEKELWGRIRGFMQAYQESIKDEGNAIEDAIHLTSDGCLYHLCLKVKEHGTFNNAAIEDSHAKYVITLLNNLIEKFIFEGIELRPVIPVNLNEDMSYHIQFRCRRAPLNPIEIVPSEHIVNTTMARAVQKIYSLIANSGDDGITKTELTHGARTISSSVRQNIIDTLVTENKVRVEVSQPYRKKKFTYYAT